jgi:hypothetical protein
MSWELGPTEEAGMHKDACHRGRRERWETPNDLHGPTPRPCPYRGDSIGGNHVDREERRNGISLRHRMSFCAGMSTEIGASIRYRKKRSLRDRISGENSSVLLVLTLDASTVFEGARNFHL